ncbi:MAG: hypothetical protein EHM79_02250 [Geobacter sp.]|nr:MAG: hypothetical protein EHM79_02250 [Geobacter sp.]
MAKTCFLCERTNSIVCDGHCGGCPKGEDSDQEGKPSERMYDGRAWIPGDVSAEALAKEEDEQCEQ